MDQLPQNLKALLQAIAEDSVILLLSMGMAKANKRGWKVYRSYTEDSCDIVLRRVHGTPQPGYRKELRLEVKARQNVITARTGNQMHFQLTKAEYDSCHFLVAYWFDKHAFFVVPRSKLKPSTSRKTHYRFIANVLKTGEYNDSSRKHLEKWDRVFALIQ